MSSPLGSQERLPAHQYPLLIVTVGGMLLVGLLMILSASHVSAFERYGSSFVFFDRQLIGVVLGVTAAFVLSRINYHHLRKLAGPMLAVVIALLLLVLMPGIGISRSGSSRWLPFGPFTVQPSELAKLVLVIYTAHMLERKRNRIANFKELVVPVLPVGGLVALLVVMQPDLGTAVICAACVMIVMFLAGARARHMAALLSLGALAVTALAFSEGYRRARLFTFLNPWADPSGSGWQPIQGQIALGSGGLFGLGLGASRQKWSYVPNAHTDFIYAIVGEELGLAGTLGVLALFVFLIYLGIRTARKAPDRFGFLLAAGITGWLGTQALINMGAVTGLLPITGVPLPLISFGGSSLVFTLAGVGILLSVARRGRY